LINFSNFKYNKHKERINKNILFTVGLIASLIYFAFILYLQAKQFKTFLNLKADFYELDRYVTQQRYIFDEKIALNKKLKTLKNKKNILFLKVFNIKNILKIILRNIPKDCCLDEFLYFKNKNHIVHIKGKSRSWQSLSIFTTEINNKIGKITKHKQQTSKELIIYDLELLL